MNAALQAGVAVLERAVAYCLGSLNLVTPALLERPTPCAWWDLHDLLEHLIDSMAALEEAVSEGRVGPVVPVAAITGGQVIPLARDRAVRLLGAWTNARDTETVRIEQARLSAPLVAGAGAIEVTVHGWDVARACGVHRPIPADLAAELLDLAVVLLRARDRPGRFGRPLVTAGDAGPGDRLLAFLGRTP